MTASDPRLAAFAELLAVIDRLRDPGGCPWDRDQSLESMTPSLLEEAHEAIDAIQSGRRADAAGEFGDLLMNVLLACRIAQDAGDFSLEHVSRAIADKLVRRHPHVFAGGEAKTVDAVLEKWEAIKREERAGSEDRSALAGIPAALPALLKAQRMGEKAARVGFKWKSTDGALAKLDEELAELKRAIGAGERDARAIDEEVGDVLFCVVNVARHTGIDAESALSRAASRFGARFRRLEADRGEALGRLSAGDLESAWRSAKTALADDAARVPPGAPAVWRAAILALHRSGERIEFAVRDLPADLCARVPATGVSEWSIDTVLEHLVLVADAVGRGLARRLAEAGDLPSFPDRGLAARGARRQLAIPTETVAAPPVVAPKGGAARDELLPRLAAARAALWDLLPRVCRIDPRTLLLPHPILGDLDVLEWFEFLELHDRRHAAQIERIRRSFADG